MAHDGGFIEEGSFCASSSSSPLLPLLLLLLVFFCCFLDMVPSGGLVSKVGLRSLFALLLFRQTKRRNGFFFVSTIVQALFSGDESGVSDCPSTWEVDLEMRELRVFFAI